ncbi:hypothetical protein ACIBEA_14545 [Streptomyces sp. NPDC051555]|uniref:hypothetical protein n=1 Tax=Streptomyces sp. NPDC051555 TaxID=3365657 RepID=UPI003787AC9A
MASAPLPRVAAEPERVIEEAVLAAEPDLAAPLVEAVLVATVKRRPARRELAEALMADPGLLTSGRPEGPRAVERLIRALLDQGAVNLKLPCCARCGNARPLKAWDGDQRICGSCLARRIAVANPCVICGSRNFSGRDHLGRPRCRRHAPDEGLDVLTELCRRISVLAPGLSHLDIANAVRTTDSSRNGQTRLLRALEEVPGLLSGDGAHGPPRTIRLIKALADRGASALAIPPCPFCLRDVPLSHTRQDLRCCTMCWRATRTQQCSHCHRERWIASRTADGEPLCGPCGKTDILNQLPCTSCGNIAPIVQRTGDQALCQRCYQRPTATCSNCGQLRPCYYASTGTPRCGPCHSKAQPHKICTSCGTERRAVYRTPAGDPLCTPCGAPRVPCVTCGHTRRVTGRTAQGEPLCEGCWERHPRARRPCTTCGAVERLYHHGLCTACAAQRTLLSLLTGPDGAVREDLTPSLHAMRLLPPAAVLRWLRGVPALRAILKELASAQGPVTHQTLDLCHPPKVVSALRAVLMAGGALPDRDEHLAALEQWLPRTYARIENTADRKSLRSYTTWNPMRRLRRLPSGKKVTHGQADAVRHEIRNAVRLLEWLRAQDLALRDCTQDHLDVWLADGPDARALVRSFLLWAHRHGHARPLDAPSLNSNAAVNLIARDQRWSMVRHLVQTTSLDVVDRAAGLLLLLFGQPPSRIIQLTTDHVVDHGDKITIRLGRTPAELPAPLDDLIRQLVDRRQGHAAARPAEESKWLFPGGLVGRPLSPAHLSKRLKAAGVRPRLARNTALMDIASELPAAVVSRLLGVHQNTADAWRLESEGPGAAYAADLIRR